MKLGNRYRTGTPSQPCCSGGLEKHQCDRRAVKSITRSGDKVYVILDDCTYIEAPLDVVDTSIKTQSAGMPTTSNEEFLAKLNEVSELLKNSQLQPVYTLDNTAVFNATNVNQ